MLEGVGGLVELESVRKYGKYAGLFTVSTLLYRSGSWLFQNKEGISHGVNCLLNKGLKSQRDVCLKTIDYVKEYVPGCHNLNISNSVETKEKFKAFIENARTCDSAESMLKKMNAQINDMWDKCHPNIKNELEKKGLSKIQLTLQSMPEDGSALIRWVSATTNCLEDQKVTERNLQKCEKEKSIKEEKIEKAKDETTKAKGETIEHQKKSKEEIDPLMERKGECKDLEALSSASAASKRKAVLSF